MVGSLLPFPSKFSCPMQIFLAFTVHLLALIQTTLPPAWPPLAHQAPWLHWPKESVTSLGTLRSFLCSPFFHRTFFPPTLGVDRGAVLDGFASPGLPLAPKPIDLNLTVDSSPPCSVLSSLFQICTRNLFIPSST